jgi:hypothetical protein
MTAFIDQLGIPSASTPYSAILARFDTGTSIVDINRRSTSPKMAASARRNPVAHDKHPDFHPAQAAASIDELGADPH